MAQNDFTAFDVSQTGNVGGISERASQGAASNEDNSVSLDILNQGLDSGIKYADREVKEAAERELRSAVDTEQGRVREGEVQLETTKAKFESMPPEIREKMKDIERQEMAVASGKLNRTAYFSRLDAVARELRSRYPGYRDEIDQNMQRYTGIKPANAVADAIFDRYERSVSSEQKSYDHWMDKAQQAGLVAPFVAQSRGYKIPQNELALMVVKAQRDKLDEEARRHSLSDLSTKLTIKEKQSGILDKEIDRNMSAQVSYHVGKISDEILDVNSPSDTARVLREAQERRAKGIVPTPDQQRQLDSVAVQLSQRRDREFLKWSNTGPEGGSSPSQMMSGDELKKKKEQWDLGYDKIIKAISSNDLAATAAVKVEIENMNQRGEYGARLASDALNSAVIISKTLGPQPFIEFMKSQEGTVKGQSLYFQMTKEFDIARKVISNHVAASLEPTNNKGLRSSSARDDLRLESRAGTSSPAMTMTVVEAAMNGAINSKQSPEISKAFVEYLYGEKNMEFMKDIPYSDRVKLLTIMTKPDMTDQIKKLEAKSPGAFDRYKTWAERSAMASLSADVSAINNEGRMTTPLKLVTFDDKTGQLKVEFNKAYGGPNRPRYQDVPNETSHAVDRTNKVLTTLKPIFDNDVARLKQFLFATGYDLARPPQPTIPVSPP